MSKKFILLTLLFLFGALARFYQLGEFPSGFHADEAAYGYNTYSLIKTGADEYGKILPIILKSFGEYKPALYSYVSIPAVLLFDLTPFAVRFTSAFFGSLSIILMFFLAKKLLKSERVGLIASLLLAISPWHINLSRTVSEVVVALFFILLLCISLLNLRDNKSVQKLWVGVAFISGVFAIITYTAATLFVILLTIIFVGFTFKDKKTKAQRIVISGIFSALLFVGIAYSAIGSINRFNQINIFQHPQTKLVTEEQIREDEFQNPFITRAFHNKIMNTARTAVDNYNEYFTINFLFLEGGFPLRMRVESTGLFYLWEILFLSAGFVMLILKKRNVAFLLGIWWALLIIPAAITFDEIPNVYRSLVILPPVIMIMSYGISRTIEYKNKFIKLGLVAVLLFAIWEFFYYGHQYFAHQEVHQPWHRGFAYKELASDLEYYSPNYKEFVITKSESSPYIYLLFFTKYNPKTYQQQGSKRDLTFDGFGKYRFSEYDCPLHGGKTLMDDVVGEKGVLYVNKGNCPLPSHSVKVIKNINWKDNSPAFTLIEYAGGDEDNIPTRSVPKIPQE